jgi:peptidoglycan/LPS O-acetylase OafA/YrhL
MSFFSFQNQPIDLKNNAFDFMRLLLALLVVVSHTATLGLFGMEPHLNLTDFKFFYEGLITVGGFAVYSFFTISGFLITGSWFNSNNDWALFVKKRLVRIVPAFWTALIVITIVFLPFSYVLQNGNLITYFQDYFVKSLGFVTKNLFFDINLWGIDGLFSVKGDGGNTIDGPIWTIRYELYAYFWVVVLGLLNFLQNSRKLISIFFALWATYVAMVFVPNFRNTLGNIFNDVWWIPLCTYFFAGSLLFIFKDKINWSFKYFLISAIVIVLGIIANLFPLVGPIFFSFFILYLGLRLPITNLTKRMGDFSYGIYIYSWPIQKLLTIAGINQFGIFVYGGLSLILSIGAGYLSWNLVEKKFLKHKS